jgi:hypothetical protein
LIVFNSLKVRLGDTKCFLSILMILPGFCVTSEPESGFQWKYVYSKIFLRFKEI